MNLYQLNSGAVTNTITNLNYDIGEYSNFIKNALELLKREAFKVEVVTHVTHENFELTY